MDIFSTIATAAHISKAVYDIASQYSNASKEIYSFAQGVERWGLILDQFDRLFKNSSSAKDAATQLVIETVLDQNRGLLAELEQYRDALYAGSDQARHVGLRGKSKWVFQASELQLLQTQVDRAKAELITMMNLHILQAQNQSNYSMEEIDTRVRILAADSSAYAKRQQLLEEQILDQSNPESDNARKRMSITVAPTAATTRSTRESILKLYGREGYRNVAWDNREAEDRLQHAAPANFARASVLIEEFLIAEGDDEDGQSNGALEYLAQNIELPASAGLDDDLISHEAAPNPQQHIVSPTWYDDALWPPTFGELPANTLRIIYHGTNTKVVTLEGCNTVEEITVAVFRQLDFPKQFSKFYSFYTLRFARQNTVQGRRLSGDELVRICKDKGRNYIIMARQHSGPDADELRKAWDLYREQEQFHVPGASTAVFTPTFKPGRYLESEPKLENPEDSPSDTGNLPAPRWANVNRTYSEETHFWYMVECTMEDGRHWKLSRHYDDFHDMQVELLKQFPEEAGMTGATRILPIMVGPAHQIAPDDLKLVARTRRVNLDVCLRQLLALPPHISKCRPIRLCFAPRKGDVESTPEYLELINRLWPSWNT